MTGKGGLTVEAMKKLWKKEFLPSIRREMKAEIDSVKTDIKKIEARFDKIEESQAFLSDKYDGIIETLQSSKKQAAAAEAKAKDQDKEIYNLQMYSAVDTNTTRPLMSFNNIQDAIVWKSLAFRSLRSTILRS